MRILKWKRNFHIRRENKLSRKSFIYKKESLQDKYRRKVISFVCNDFDINNYNKYIFSKEKEQSEEEDDEKEKLHLTFSCSIFL